jgi:hypothetical protein
MPLKDNDGATNSLREGDRDAPSKRIRSRPRENSLSFPLSDGSGHLLRKNLHLQKENQSQHFLAGQAVGIREVDDGIWLVSFMDYDLGYIDLEERTLQPLNNPFGPKV